MTSPRDIRGFTEQWLDTFDWFEEHPTEDLVTVTESPKRAAYLRFEFYRARQAMMKENELRRMYINTQRRGVYVEGNTVTFRFKEKTPMAELLKTALQQANDKLAQEGDSADV